MDQQPATRMPVDVPDAWRAKLGGPGPWHLKGLLERPAAAEPTGPDPLAATGGREPAAPAHFPLGAT